MKISTGWNPIAPDPASEGRVLDMVIEQAVQADQAGLSCLYFTEHHFAGIAPWANPFMMASHVAGKITNAHVGFAICVVPLHHPIRLAEQANFLDQVTKGKFIFGVGGGGISTEFAGFWAHSADSSQLHSDSFDVVQKLWAKKEDDAPIVFDVGDGLYRGQLLQRIMPAAYSPKGPRIKAAVTSPDRMKKAAENGWSTFLFMAPMVSSYRKMLEKAGHDEQTIARAMEWTSCSAMTYVGETDEQAMDDAMAMMQQRSIANERNLGFAEQMSWMRQKPTPTMIVGNAGGPEGAGIAGGPPGGGPPPGGPPGMGGAKGGPPPMPAMPPGMSMERMMLQMGFVGSVETVIRKVKEMADMGVPEVSIGMDLGSYTQDVTDKVRRSYDLFCNKVMPAIKDYEPDLERGKKLIAAMPMPPMPGLAEAA